MSHWKLSVHYMQPGWCQPVRQEFMENECEALPGVAYPGVQDNHSTLNTKTGYDDDDDDDSLAHLPPNIKFCENQSSNKQTKQKHNLIGRDNNNKLS